MKTQMWKLIVVTASGEQIDVEYADIEVARQTGNEWITKGWARGFFIERV